MTMENSNIILLFTRVDVVDVQIVLCSDKGGRSIAPRKNNIEIIATGMMDKNRWVLEQ